MKRTILFAALGLLSIPAFAHEQRFECRNGNYRYTIVLNHGNAAQVSFSNPHLGEGPTPIGACSQTAIASSVAVTCITSGGALNGVRTLVFDRTSGNYSETQMDAAGSVTYSGTHNSGGEDDICAALPTSN